MRRNNCDTRMRSDGPLALISYPCVAVICEGDAAEDDPHMNYKHVKGYQRENL